MFTKRQNKESAPKVAAPVAAKDTEILTTKEEHGAVSTPTINEEKTNTIISKDVVFEGNITSNEQVHIYGKVIGNITGKDNIVKVMLNGQVNGNITCKELIVNGRIDGECLSDSISIETHGEITGIINYSSLSIKKGGILSGQANVKTSTINTNKQAFPKDKIKKDTAVNQPIEPASL